MPAIFPFTANDDLVRVLNKLGLFLGNFLNVMRPTVAKTANYSIDPAVDPSGTRFTNRGAAGAVTFTLPAPTPALAGTSYEFSGVADQNIIVSGTAAKQVAFNNAACASLAAQTAGQKIGAVITAICDGTSWLLHGSTIGVTYTVA
jgi:hypothetical protein